MKIYSNLYLITKQSQLSRFNKTFYLHNYSKKTFLNFFSRVGSKNKEMIIHPEFGGEQIISGNKKINSKDGDDLYEDSTLSFIALDKNGVPQIKKTYYESLGVKNTASNPEIKSNFLKIARKYHPDKHPESLVNFI
jgi:hypothetical protein